jgi:hypothetical protein
MRRNPPEGEVEILGGFFLVLRVTDDDVCAFSSKTGDDSLEA